MPTIDVSSLAFLATPARDLPPWLAVSICAWVFVVGSTIGSFLNVVIGRMPEGLSVVKPRSRCPVCETQIAFYDNIPILSWLVLRGKCRSCSTSISPRYIFIEILVGLLAVAIALRFGLSLRGIELFFFTCILVCIAFIDLDTWTIPIPLLAYGAIIPLIAGGLAFWFPDGIPTTLDQGLRDPAAAFQTRLIGGIGGVVFLGAMVIAATYYARKMGRIAEDETALGWGDPLLFGAIGFVVGWPLMPLVLLLASVQGILAYPIAKFARPNSGDENPSAEGEAASNAPSDDDVNEKEASEKPTLATTSENAEEEEWEPPEAAIAWGPFLALAGLEVAFFSTPLLRFMREWIFAGQL